MIYQTILEAIGKTPLVKLNRMVGKNDAEVLVKMESFNPGASVKDRIGYAMIIDAEKRGVLKPGSTIVEPTSGNTGIALAMVAAVKGYRIILTMPETMSLERRAVLKQYGAELVLTPADKGMKGAIAEAQRLVDEKGYFMPMQFQNPANPEIHRRTTAQEILNDLNGRKLDYFVAGVGTGGTITGVSQVLKQTMPALKSIAVEPEDSPVLSGGQPGKHKIQGIGAGFVPDVVDTKIIDEIIKVKNDEAFATAKRLAKEEGILCGISAGANVFAALQVAKQAGAGKLVITVICDTGERYISTDLFKNE
jgi:cysteine synthase